MANENLVLVETKRYPLKFWCREGTSDHKAVAEVIEGNGYQRPRKGFTIQAGEHWTDLGANIGAFSVLAAHLGATVNAYEADPDSFEILKKNIAANGLQDRVTCHHYAVVADRQKKAWLSVSERNKNYWRNSIAKVWKGSRMVAVPCIHFSETFNATNCVKMDIEGSEMPILEALSFAPEKLCFEWSFDIDKDCDRFRAVMTRLSALFASLDYTPIPPDVHSWPGEWFPAAKMVYCRRAGACSSIPAGA